MRGRGSSSLGIPPGRHHAPRLRFERLKSATAAAPAAAAAPMLELLELLADRGAEQRDTQNAVDRRKPFGKEVIGRDEVVRLHIDSVKGKELIIGCSVSIGCH